MTDYYVTVFNLLKWDYNYAHYNGWTIHKTENPSIFDPYPYKLGLPDKTAWPLVIRPKERLAFIKNIPQIYPEDIVYLMRTIDKYSEET